MWNLFIAAAAAMALGYGKHAFSIIRAQKDGDLKMTDIANAIRQGADAYLKRQYKSIAMVGMIIAILFMILWQDFYIAVGFIIGAVLSGVSGFIGMKVSVMANVKTTQAAKDTISKAFNIAFKAGAVTGFLVIGLGLFGVFLYYRYLASIMELREVLTSLVALGFGASLISIFARLGGGIFTKGADVGADLVGKIEAGIPEDDPRNPAVIADNVGDNVGDCAGMAADIFETYVVTIISSMAIALMLFKADMVLKMVEFPMIISAACIFASVISTFFVKLGKKENVMGALYKGVFMNILLAMVLTYASANMYFGKTFTVEVLDITGETSGIVASSFDLFICCSIGFIVTAMLMFVTEYYTSTSFSPVRKIAKASENGHAMNVISGLFVSLESTAIPIIIICIAIMASFSIGGLYGLSLSAVSMLAMSGMIIALDAYGPVTDNAGGIAEMAGLDSKVRKITDKLDAVGNTTKAVTKGYAIGSAALAALVLFVVYVQDINHYFPENIVEFSLFDPYTIVGLFFGGMLPYLFSSYSMRAVSVAGGKIVEEVRRQFKTIKGIMTGKTKPDYKKAIDILTKSAIRQMILPAMLPVLSPFLFYFFVYAFTGSNDAALTAVGAMLLGTIITGVFVAISMTSGGGAWDNAKKYIEDGNHGGKGSTAHKAAVTGDTIGDPYKDTAGPAINPMIKIVNIVALLLLYLLK